MALLSLTGKDSISLSPKQFILCEEEGKVREFINFQNFQAIVYKILKAKRIKYSPNKVKNKHTNIHTNNTKLQ